MKDPGDSSGEATPVPISNTEVKLSSAEDTQGVAPRENRSSPGSFLIPSTYRRPTVLALTAAAPVRHEAACLDLRNARPTARTRLAALPVHVQELALLDLEPRWDEAPELPNCPRDHLPCRFVQRIYLGRGKRRASAERSQAGLPEDLVRIGVADPGDERLVAQQVLQL